MLTPADADIVRRDPALPGLAVLLDPGAFAEQLRQRAGGADVISATPTYLRYKPGTSCLAGYRLDVGGTAVDVYARGHRTDDAGKLLKLARAAQADDRARGTALRSPLGSAAFHLAGLAVVVCVFPYDDAIPSLRMLAGAAGLHRLLRKVAPGSEAAAAAGVTDVAPLAYKPERRFVGLLRRDGAPAAVLRFYAPGGFAAAARNAKLVRSSGALRVPQRLGRHREHHVFALEWLPGRPVSEIMLGRAEPPPAAFDVMRRAGAALAALGREPFGPKLRRRTPAHHAAAIRAAAKAVAEVHPPAGELASQVAARLVSCLEGQATGRENQCPIHGDFHARQVLFEPSSGGVSLIDFDELVLSDAAADLGSFVADLEHSALRGEATAGLSAEADEALREGFRHGDPPLTAVGTDFDKRVRGYTAAGLFRLAMDPFRSRDPDWPSRTEVLLQRVTAILDDQPRSATTSRIREPTPRVSDPFNAAADAAIPTIRAALDLPGVSEHLTPLLCGGGFGGGNSAEVTAARVMRHKVGRRCLIEYDVSLSGSGRPSAEVTLIAKVRAKGADERAHALLVSLWGAGFAADSADGISVPRPVGVVGELGLTLQLKVPGTPASRCVPGPRGADVAARLADAVHKLHEVGAAGHRHHTLYDERTILQSRLQLAAESRPELARRIAELRDACDRLMDAMGDPPETRLRRIHRDYYPEQVIVDATDGRLYILDLDNSCTGDPDLDVGNCLAHITEQATREGGDPDAFAQEERKLLDRYVELTGTRAVPRVKAYAALTLARHVQISTLFAQRHAFTARLLELSTARVRDAYASVR